MELNGSLFLTCSLVQRFLGESNSINKNNTEKDSRKCENYHGNSSNCHCILNDRPLTYPSSDIKDSEALTPAHLLYGRKMTTVPYPQIDVDTTNFISTRNYNKIVERQNELNDHSWSRWRREYLTSMREFHKSSGYNQQSI